jgi:hypothetical protein
MIPQNTDEKPFFELTAQLTCGALIKFLQPERDMNITVTLTPPPGVPISDVADIKNDKLTVRSTVDSMVGVYQVLKHMAHDSHNTQKFPWLIFSLGAALMFLTGNIAHYVIGGILIMYSVVKLKAKEA